MRVASNASQRCRSRTNNHLRAMPSSPRLVSAHETRGSTSVVPLLSDDRSFSRGIGGTSSPLQNRSLMTHDSVETRSADTLSPQWFPSAVPKDRRFQVSPPASRIWDIDSRDRRQSAFHCSPDVHRFLPRQSPLKFLQIILWLRRSSPPLPPRVRTPGNHPGSCAALGGNCR